jgi:hypothetical protein
MSLAAMACVLAVGCRQAPSDSGDRTSLELAGEWRSAVRFRGGTFASIDDLEFMYVFHAGGTMTESSNYDAAPPMPPAYGIWRRTGPGRFEAKYEFYATKPPAALDEIMKGGGWLPAGRGVLLETITLSDDADAFTSTIRYDAFDRAGNPIEGGGEATGRGVRLTFSPTTP